MQQKKLWTTDGGVYAWGALWGLCPCTDRHTDTNECLWLCSDTSTMQEYRQHSAVLHSTDSQCVRVCHQLCVTTASHWTCSDSERKLNFVDNEHDLLLSLCFCIYVMSYLLTHRHTHRHTHTVRQTQTDRHKHTHTQTDRQTHRQTDTHTHTDRQTDTDRQRSCHSWQSLKTLDTNTQDYHRQTEVTYCKRWWLKNSFRRQATTKRQDITCFTSSTNDCTEESIRSTLKSHQPTYLPTYLQCNSPSSISSAWYSVGSIFNWLLPKTWPLVGWVRFNVPLNTL